MIEDSLQEVGAARSIVIDENNRILAGNQTTEAAANVGLEDVMIVDAPGDKLVAVRRSNLTEQQKTRLALWDNRSAEVATWSSEMLAKMQQEDEALLQGLFRADELEAILGDLAQEPVADPGAQIDRAAELQEKWQIERGQIWEIGRHCLMCGNMSDRDNLEVLMGGDKADMAFSDPPFAIYGSSTGVSQKVADASMVLPFFRDMAHGLAYCTRYFAHVYVCCDWRSFNVLTSAASDSLTLKNMIVWVKPGGNVAGVFYTNVHELIAFFVNSPPETSMFKKKTGHRQIYDQNVWQQNVVPVAQRGHFAQKPLENVVKAIENSTDAEEVVVDLFLGSGTTLVACEQTGRIGYGMEIEPKYCAVTLERLAGMGLEAALLT
jgi:hypothetical protein